MTVLYADLSHHDWDRVKGEFDWGRIKAATSPVLCLRATYGDPAGYNPTTRHFGDMVTGARRAGFDLIGGYHNLIKGDQSSINRQVDYLRRTLDGAGATWAMLDVERYPELVSNGLWPRWDDVQQFCARWHAVDSRVLALYLPEWLWSSYLGKPDLRTLGCPLTASNYGSNPGGSPAAVYKARGGDTGPGWGAYGNVTPAMWQYGSNIDCPGASGSTDVNAFRGTLAQLRALLTDQPQGDDMDAEQDRKLDNLDRLNTALLAGQTTVTGLRLQDGTTASMPLPIAAQVKAAADAANQALAIVKTLAAQPAVAVDYDKLAGLIADAIVRRVLTPPA